MKYLEFFLQNRRFFSLSFFFENMKKCAFTFFIYSLLPWVRNEDERATVGVFPGELRGGVCFFSGRGLVNFQKLEGTTFKKLKTLSKTQGFGKTQAQNL